ncbi:MAG: bifunctional DNA-formamidopyrimidine glycosylase/DNA-(apurinic or apyrimidinic site) lyase [Patescibacteria group bacterium]|nr:bifunctional DNA-formamidopyrimidine glycosylase/DNA-(apurinic or apyrimidinic site) lyase [Patescibacteria group bacterium]
MPELPEVESIKIQLEKYLLGHRIVDLFINSPRVFEGVKEEIIGSTFVAVRRFAKALSLDLSNDKSLVIHIKLTGQLIYRGVNLPNPPPISKKVIGGVSGKHTHVVFVLDKNSFLYYNDVRLFGWIKVVDTKDVENIGFVGKLGPEPFGKEGGKPELLTYERFRDILAKSKRAIKTLLMDQSKIGGIGNIYANDALWLAGIHPERQAGKLSDSESKVLYDAIIAVLRKGIETGGASELAFVTPDGQEGTYQNHTLAYGRNGKKCPRCKKSTFEKYFLAGRGTYICKICQKK